MIALATPSGLPPASENRVLTGNPWLDIPLADYEGHMVLPQVAQAGLLADVFEPVLKTYPPAAGRSYRVGGGALGARGHRAEFACTHHAGRDTIAEPPTLENLIRATRDLSIIF